MQRFARVLVTGVIPTAGLVAVGTPASATTEKAEFAHTGAAQSFVVPDGVTSIEVDAFGAQGGASAVDVAETPLSDSAVGGLGGRTRTTIEVTPGETLQVNVGGQGGTGTVAVTPTTATATGGIGGFNVGGCGNGAGAVFGDGVGEAGGDTCANGVSVSTVGPPSGSAAAASGGGGGGSDVRRGGTDLTDRVVIAGGGGGACGVAFADPDLSSVEVRSGGGGGGAVGESAAGALSGGGGTQVAGGTSTVDPGVLGVGGAGAHNAVFTLAPNSTAGAGGGGGGGFFGGGGGAVDLGEVDCGAGGGGSGFAEDAVSETGVRQGDGLVVLTHESSGTPLDPDAPVDQSPAEAVPATPRFAG